MQTKMPHPGHEEHLCYLQNIGFLRDNWDDYKKLVKDPNYVCKVCGRTAASDKNLCAPEKKKKKNFFKGLIYDQGFCQKER